MACAIDNKIWANMQRTADGFVHRSVDSVILAGYEAF
jgi:hypothetical protein